MIRGPLTAELNSKDSPVRRFLDERFTSGLRDVQRRYRQASPTLVVPSADRQEANPGTVGTAADWLLRFMLHPRPSLALAAKGAALCGRRSGVVEAFIEIAESLGYDPEAVFDMSATDFTGPIDGNHTDPEQLASVCWALAVLTEMFRNPMVAMTGPLQRFQDHRALASELLRLASPAALGQLAAFREVFASTLLPKLSDQRGRWVLGAEFTGSALIKADADVIAAGLLLDLKTDSKLSLGVTTVFQVLGYALLDFDDAYQLANVGTFSARYAYLATWDIGALFDELAGRHVDPVSIRQEFRQLLLAHQLSDLVTFAVLTESWLTITETAQSRHHGCPVTAITVTRSDGRDNTDVRRPGARSFGRREVDSEGSQSRCNVGWKSVQHVFNEFVLPRLPER